MTRKGVYKPVRGLTRAVAGIHKELKKTKVKNNTFFLHTGYGNLRFYPGIENLILPRLSGEDFTLIVLELTHMVVKLGHCYLKVASSYHLSVFMNFWKPF